MVAIKWLTFSNCILVPFFCIAAERVGDQAIAFPFEPTDTTIIIDNVPDTDIYVKNRNISAADLTFDVPIFRYVGDVQKLKENRLIDEHVRIQFAVYDVDDAPEGVYLEEDCNGDGEIDEVAYEINKVYLNGYYLGDLSSGNNKWSLNGGFKAPIEILNFPINEGSIGNNTIEVHVDTGNEALGCKRWAAEVDFIAVSFDVVDPFILLPGLGGQISSFEASGYKDNLENNYGLPVEIIEYLPPNLSLELGDLTGLRACTDVSSGFELNKSLILNKVLVQSQAWNTDSINVISHSKGGLEALNLANQLNSSTKVKTSAANINGTLEEAPLRLINIVSHASPFLGSNLALSATGGVAHSSFLQSIFNLGAIAGYIDLWPNVCDLRPSFATEYVKSFESIPGLFQLKISADADLNDDSELDSIEESGNQLGTLGSIGWRLTGASIDSPFSVIPNDIMVTVDSASSTQEGDDIRILHIRKNHGTVIDTVMQIYVKDAFIGRTFPWSWSK